MGRSARESDEEYDTHMLQDGINFDAVTLNKIRFEKTVDGVHREWWLRDDLGAELGLAIANLLQRDFDRANQPLPTDGAQMLALLQVAYRETIADTLDIFTRLWRRSYPDEDPERLAQWFTHEERQEILQYFFLNRSKQSSTLSNGTTNATPTQIGVPSPNRNTRRRRTRKSQGGTPSQKPLLRALGAS